ncbi:hypothetical protein Mapa_011185 [Marchantia paleacea]|nr:hypothetical protein Mapa_011185 [Marchantia paleacea]
MFKFECRVKGKRRKAPATAIFVEGQTRVRRLAGEEYTMQEFYKFYAATKGNIHIYPKLSVFCTMLRNIGLLGKVFQ